MNTRLKILFASLMSTAMLFGFMHLFVGASPHNFERLHIFLFNLCSGGTIILYFTEGKGKLTQKSAIFLLLSVCYAVLAFYELYPPAMVISVLLAMIVDSIRIQKFSFFPIGFFRKSEPVSAKFHQASLLCLTLGLLISCAVILNNEYLKIVSFPKLKLDTFFLGFSFPVSLITMSLIFSMMDCDDKRSITVMREFGFWSVNLGVIIFFLFIILEKLWPQVLVTSILFVTVIMIFNLYRRLGRRLQQKNFLTSGMLFLLVTAVTGILYILFELTSGYTPERYKWLLKLHAFASLYGWNLCGLAVICRYSDFPLRLHSGPLIALHWVTVLILAPIGNYYAPLAVPAVLCYMVMLYIILFNQGSGKKV